MKRVLFLLIIFLPLLSKGQARLGYKPSAIKAEFSASYYELEDGYNSGNIYYISIKTSRAFVLYWFNQNKVCKMTFILPKTKMDLHYYIEMYNELYVNISDTEWRMYEDNVIIKIKLEYSEDLGMYYFIWYY